MGEKPILTVLKAEGHSADTGAGKFPLVSMGGRAEGLACADPGARTPIGASGINIDSSFKLKEQKQKSTKSRKTKTSLH
jgi:hypothetical protein